MLTDYTSFFELLQLSVGVRRTMSHVPVSPGEWKALMKEVDRQRLVGVCFPVVEDLFSQGKVPAGVYLVWEKGTGIIRQRNEQYRKATREVYGVFRDNGFRSCILKGLASASYYPDPLLRQCGDIDIWVEGERRKTIAFLQAHCPIGKTRYIHTVAKMRKDYPVEVHFTPSWMFSPFANRRLQRWFSLQAPEQFSHADQTLGVSVPTLRFNGSYMLLHIYRHLLEEGIGLRQILDYYYVLLGMDEACRKAVCQDLKELGLSRFAGALMYVLQQVFGLEESRMLCRPAAGRGRRLLKAILQSGNFGKNDPTFANPESKTEGILAHGWRKIKRDFRFFSLCPREVFWMPFFLVWQYFWRRRNGYLYHGR